MRVCAVVGDLIFASRILDAAERSGAAARRVQAPVDLPPPDEVDLVLVDWAARTPAWGAELARWRAGAGSGAAPRVVLFGSHLDLDGHAAAKRTGIGPVMARSQFVRRLPALMRSRTTDR